MKIPRHLSAEAKKMWRKYCAENDIEDAYGLDILRVSLEAFDRFQAARKLIDKNGMVYKDRFGSIKPNPLLGCERDARAQFLAGLKQLNLDIEPINKSIGRPPGRF